MTLLFNNQNRQQQKRKKRRYCEQINKFLNENNKFIMNTITLIDHKSIKCFPAETVTLLLISALE